MAKYKSKGGFMVDAHVVGADEKRLQASMGNGGIEHLTTGDALVTLQGQQYVVRAPLWVALFGEADEGDKGGQQTSKTATK